MNDYTDTLKIAKSMKKPIVHIDKSYMIGADTEFGTLSMIEISSDIPRAFTSIYTNILTETLKNKMATSKPDVFFNEYEDIGGLYINVWEEPILRDRIFNLFRRVMIRLNSPVIFERSGLEGFAEFVDKVVKVRVDDGLTRFTFEKDYFVTSFNKTHSINSSDKIALRIYDIDPISYLYEFLIDKKKYILKEYIRYRKVPVYRR